MLTRSLVAAFCGALVVAGRPGQDEHGYDQAHLDRQAYAQAAFNRPAWLPAPDAGKSWNPFEHGQDEPPKHPPFPHVPHQNPAENKTIYQALEEDSRFSRLFKLVNFTEEVTSILNDSNAGVTFFAVPDKALHPPKRHHKKRRSVGLAFDSPELDPFYNTVAAELSTSADEREMFAVLEGFVDYSQLDGDDDKERKRRIVKKIVTAVLKYHILPGVLPAQTLGTNNTYASGLTLGDASLDSEALRVRVSTEPRLFHRATRVNFYASILHPDVKTENGLVHVLSHPLFPPPSIFTVLFGFSDLFATLTSAIQRTNVTDDVDWHWVKESHTLEGAPAVTFFAPTNRAFRSLPPKLRLFLFSPFGARALKKILAYHVVPDYVFHTNWVHNASESLVSRSTVVDADPYTYLAAGPTDAAALSNIADEDFLGGFDPMSAPMDGAPPPVREDGACRLPPPPFPSVESPPHGHGPMDCARPPHFPPFDSPRHGGGPMHCPPSPHFPPPACSCHDAPPLPPAWGSPPPPPHFPPPPPTWGPPPHGHEPRHDPHAPPHFPPPPPPPHGFPRSECPPPFDPRDAPHFPPPPPGWEHEPRHAPPHFPAGCPPPFDPFKPRDEPHFPPPPSWGPSPSGPRPEPHFPSGCPPPFDHRRGAPPPPHFPSPPPACERGPLPPPPFPLPGHDTCGPEPHHPRPHFPRPTPVYTLDAALPALLANHTLHVHVAQFHALLPGGGYVTKLFVNGRPVPVVDVPTRNGAVHVVERLLRPFRAPPPGAPRDYFRGSALELEREDGGEREDEDEDWADWEDWLPQWANED